MTLSNHSRYGKRIRVFVLLLAIAALVSSGCRDDDDSAAAGPDSPTSGENTPEVKFAGQVEATRVTSGAVVSAPVANATVSLQPRSGTAGAPDARFEPGSGPAPQVVQTDSHGKFALVLKPGDYTMHVTAKNHWGTKMSVTVSDADMTDHPVALASNRTTSELHDALGRETVLTRAMVVVNVKGTQAPSGDERVALKGAEDGIPFTMTGDGKPRSSASLSAAGPNFVGFTGVRPTEAFRVEVDSGDAAMTCEPDGNEPETWQASAHSVTVVNFTCLPAELADAP